MYKLTEKGFYVLCLAFPFFRFIKDDWDGVWRIISYEIPESKRHLRDSLRREMRGWGLGPWHRSFWVTTHPIIPALRDLVYGREEEQYIQSFESTHMFGDVEHLVEKVWEKSVMEKKYKELFRVWHGILSKNLTKDEKYQQVLAEYVKHLKDDPGLPVNLVGRQWIGREAFDIYKEMRGILLNSDQPVAVPAA
jgi:phenylacetic acid degradation operon negative regulatory protein